ncbi:FecR domain-containing protein [Luteolibacter ambystomatis]|uniref:FecR domain-containing protein n=1 Tax=Luteolibacter ambystomatis TaxID=2824561 RepID=A0A975G8Z2_9BACT|nr:FecR domain-containing protein [Luteolibacter ambystomatis]QUE50500.1 FecR domain-containing protein [Luteolibacter ambystomatis]
MKAPDSELRRLTDAWHDGTISRGDALRLEERLLADTAARDYFFEISELEGGLAEAAAMLPPIAAKPRPQSTTGSWWKMAAVFVIGAASGALAWKMTGAKSPAGGRSFGPEATITGMMGVTWDGVAGDRSVDLKHGSGTTRITSGLLEVTFGSGTRTVIEGPANFEVTGHNSMSLTYGKVVADVPKGAEGFTVNYADGRIVDLGTEFGVDIGRGEKVANFGVFRGEIEFQPKGEGARPVRLLENHAVLAGEGRIQSVPFDQAKFTRRFPSREFAWEVKEAAAETTWDYDISHLVWKPGHYRVICKWMTGPHGVATRGAELRLDDVLVASDDHPGFTGLASLTKNNEYDLNVAGDHYRRGKWTLRLHVKPDWLADKPAVARGVVLVEEGLAVNAKPEDFIGTWEYLHDGQSFKRTFRPDGTADLLIDGKPYSTFANSHWIVKDGCLELTVPEASGPIIERHLLRDPETLVFTNRPYRDAIRAKK